MTVKAKDFPVEWPNLYCSISLRPSGIGLSMNAVGMLHKWCPLLALELLMHLRTIQEL